MNGYDILEARAQVIERGIGARDGEMRCFICGSGQYIKPEIEWRQQMAGTGFLVFYRHGEPLSGTCRECIEKMHARARELGAGDTGEEVMSSES